MRELQLPEPIDFEWDLYNELKIFLKHKIDKQEAEQAFFNFRLVVPDQRHSKSEVRFGMYGKSDTGKIMFIAFTIRKKLVRVISARPANKKERQLYEKAQKAS